MRTFSLLVSLVMALPVLAAPPLVQATGASKAGVPIIAATTSSSWTTAVLQLRLAADDVTPRQRAATTAFVAVLADAGGKVLGSAGRVEARVSADVATIAFGATADQPELPLRALDAALRALKTAKPTVAVSPAVLDIVDDDLDVGSAALLVPGRAAGLVVDGGVLDAASFKALADTVRTDRVAVGVVGPGTPPDVLARAVKVLGAPITRGPAPGVAAAIVDDKRSILVEQRKDTVPTSTVTWWTSTPSAKERAAAIVLAELLGGRVARGGDRFGVVVTVTGTDRTSLLLAETDKTEQLKKLTTTAPTATELSTAVTTALRSRLSRIDDPARLAHALSRGLLDAADAAAELAAIESTNAAAVTAAAIRFGAAVQLTRRAAPAATAPMAVQKTTTTTTVTTTTTPAGAKR